MAYFKVIENRATGQSRWQLLGDNNEVICHGETHPTKYNADRAVDALPEHVADAAQRLVIYETEHEAPPSSE